MSDKGGDWEVGGADFSAAAAGHEKSGSAQRLMKSIRLRGLSLEATHSCIDYRDHAGDRVEGLPAGLVGIWTASRGRQASSSLSSDDFE